MRHNIIHIPMLMVSLFYGLIAGYSPLIGLALFTIGLFFILFCFNITLGVYLSLFAIPFDRIAKLGAESPITIAKVILLLVLLILIVRTLTLKDPKPLEKLYHNPLTILSYLFLAFSLISLINAQSTEFFFGQLSRRVNIVLLYLLLISIIVEKRTLLWCLYITLLANILVAMIGIYELFTGQAILQAWWGKKAHYELHTLISGGFRISGPSGDPNFHAGIMMFSFLLVTMFFYFSKSILRRAALLGCGALFLINILGTGSRGALLGLLIGLFLFWLISQMRWKYIIGVGALILLLTFGVLFSTVNPSAPTERYTGEYGLKSIQYRIGLTKMAFNIVKDYPLVGVGTGNFLAVYNRYIVPEVPRSPLWTHNSFMQIWAENGFFALLVYLGIYFASSYNAICVIRASKDPYLKSVAVVILSGIASYFIFAGTSNVLENENYWILFAFSVVVWQIHRQATAIKGNPSTL